MKNKTTLTFPKIASQNHPLASGKLLQKTSDKLLNPDQMDFKIAREIVAVHKKISKKTTADGEWSWINDKLKKIYIDALNNEDVKLIAKILANMFRDEITYGLISSSYRDLDSLKGRKGLENHILLDLDAWHEFADQNRGGIKNLDTPRVGNSYGLMIEPNILISVDNPRHDYFALKLIRLGLSLKKDKFTLLEIGGGYGGLCYQIFRRTKKVRYINVDLPESLYLAYYFLRKSMPKKQIKWVFDGLTENNLKEGSIFFVPAQTAKKITCKVDVVFNCHSLSEMSKKAVNGYMQMIDRWSPLFFLHQNSNFLLFPKSLRHIEVLASDFRLTKYREIYKAVSIWQGAGGRYREYLFKLKP